ncbi:hypothetical protein CTRI78_v006499 [Colletotrichum trifolii]|uniref:Uncharacterized protein n=1 Tax=Colletotrichum trifolii TaxID=5466 RepID=A0A4R8RC59_COLTR|nr:hypothetical protein CTRI78_v006499 [Colletotrichum trifolii]
MSRDGRYGHFCPAMIHHYLQPAARERERERGRELELRVALADRVDRVDQEGPAEEAAAAEVVVQVEEAAAAAVVVVQETEMD